MSAIQILKDLPRNIQTGNFVPGRFERLEIGSPAASRLEYFGGRQYNQLFQEPEHEACSSDPPRMPRDYGAQVGEDLLIHVCVRCARRPGGDHAGNGSRLQTPSWIFRTLGLSQGAGNRVGRADFVADHVGRPAFGLVINTADIFTQHTGAY